MEGRHFTNFACIITITFAILVKSNCLGFQSLSRDETKDQIFVQGNWYNKDGSTNKAFTALGDIKTASTFQQCMHHDNSSGCTKKWTQRYWEDNRYYTKGGPAVFIEIAGEWDAEYDITYGQWFSYARRHKAKMIVLEHRFYGKSFPKPREWLMTSQYAFADAAYFIDDYKKKNNLPTSKWVAFGCSYGGNLAAWFKLKYPNHVKTAVSSSGPLEAIYDFPGYVQVVSQVIQSVDQACYDLVSRTFACMEAFTNGTEESCGPYEDLDSMKNAAHFCWNVEWDNSMYKELMYTTLAFSQWGTNTPRYVAERACRALMQADPGAHDVEHYGNFMRDQGYDGGCDSSAMGVNAMTEKNQFMQSQEAWSSGAAQWQWQTCNEFGYFMSSDPVLGSFGRNTWSGNVYGQYCGEYGAKFTREYVEGQIKKTNAHYGGKNIQSKCVIFVHGSDDPWHLQGVITPRAGNTVIVVPGAEHCGDLGNPSTSEMADAQKTIQKQIGTYLNDPNC